jgi:hypothetical protein
VTLAIEFFYAPVGFPIELTPFWRCGKCHRTEAIPAAILDRIKQDSIMASTNDSGRLRNQFFLPPQEQSNWCWAAVGVSLAKYFHGLDHPQCELVQAVTNIPGVDCCGTPDNPACNAVQRISLVLEEINVPHRGDPGQPQATLSYNEIRGDIQNDRPIICLMSGDTGYHYVVIVGWFLQNGIPWLRVDDPADGFRKETSFSDFLQQFEGRALDQATRLA